MSKKNKKKSNKEKKKISIGRVILNVIGVIILCLTAFLITLKICNPDFKLDALIPQGVQDVYKPVVNYFREELFDITTQTEKSTTSAVQTTKPTTTRGKNLNYIEFSDFAFDTSLQGNQIGNLLNNSDGSVTFSAAYGYFSIMGDGIYRFEPNNETNAGVKNGEFSLKYLNVLGDYIYYVDADTDKLMRSKNFGGDDTEVANNIEFAYLYGDKIYFVGTDNTVGYVTTKDFERVDLYSPTLQKDVKFIGISLSRVFFSEYDATADTYQYITVNLNDSKDKQYFRDDTKGDEIINIQLEGGYFYYYQKQDNGFYNLIRQKYGSDKSVTLLEKCSLTDYPVIYANRLYYTQLTDGKIFARELNMNSMADKVMLFVNDSNETQNVGVCFGYQYIFLAGTPKSDAKRICMASSIYTSSSDNNTISFNNGKWSY